MNEITASSLGTLIAVGVGPGDPELITLKAARIIASAAVVAYPAPEEGDGLARQIASAHLAPGVREIVLRMPFTNDRLPAERAYDQGAATIAQELESGRNVVYLCEGDSLFFGSFVYVLERLGERFLVQVVPGILSPVAAASALAHPLTKGEAIFAVAPASRSEQELSDLLHTCDSLAFLKVGRHAAKLRRVLEGAGLLQKAWYAARVGQASELLKPFAAVAPDDAVYFSLVLVRK